MALAIAARVFASDLPVPPGKPTPLPWDAGENLPGPDVDPPPECGDSVPCGCGDRLTGVLTLWEDLLGCPGNGILIGADNVVIDCAGHVIEGGSGAGVANYGYKNVVIRDCEIRGFQFGVFCLDAESLLVTGNRFIDNRRSGVRARRALAARIEENDFHGNGRQNYRRKTGGIITLADSRECVIRNNTAADNGDTGNDVGGIVLRGSRANTIEGNTLAATGSDNIWLRLGSHGNTVVSNVISGAELDGIWIRESNNNIVESNTLLDVQYYGIYVRSGYANVIRGNRITRAGLSALAGIGLGGLEYNSTGNSILDNEVVDTREGLRFHQRAFGNVAARNVLLRSGTGLYLGDGRTGPANRLEDCRIEGSTTRDLHLDGEDIAAVLASTPIDTGSIAFECRAGSCEIEIRWRFELRVAAPGGEPIGGAAVSIRNGEGEPAFSGNTGPDGTIPTQELTESVLSADGNSCFNDYVVEIVKDGYEAFAETVTVDRDRTEAATLSPLTVTAKRGESREDEGAYAIRVGPNPLRERTVLHFTLPSESHVSIRLYDVRGRLVDSLVDGSFGTGAHAIEWNRRSADRRHPASGIYFARISTAFGSLTTKLVIVDR